MVIGAFGRIGRLVVKEALDRGVKVTAIAHRNHPDIDLGDATIVIKDVFTLNANDLKGYTAVVDATGGWNKKTASIIYNGLWHIVQILKGSDTHYIKVGGTNTLFINRDHSQTLQNLSSYYSDKFKFLCDAHSKSLNILRKYSNISWTYVTPTFNFSAKGLRTGKYQVEGEEFKANLSGDDGKNDYISYADFVIGLMDIIVENKYIRQQVTLIHGDKPIK